MPEFYFLLFALAILGGAAAVILPRNPALHVTGFLAVMLGVAGCFALLDQSFLFLAQVLVAVGAVVVLTLIVIASINLREESLPAEKSRWLWLAGAVAVVAPIGALLYRALTELADPFPPVTKDFGSAQSLGISLFGDWVLPFEVLSLLLLAAMVGAIVIGRNDSARTHDKERT